MAKSKHRKKQVAENKKHLEKAKRKHIARTSNLNGSRRKSEDVGKENVDTCDLEYQPSPSGLESAVGKSDDKQLATVDGSGWLTGIYGWCQAGLSNVVTQSMEVAKDVMFPSRGLKKELEEAKEKLREMERELNSIKRIDYEDKNLKAEECQAPVLLDNSSGAPPPPCAPPPPPPPPPPPIPPPQAPISFRKVMTRSKTSKLAKVGTELPPITLDDIKKIKLKPRGASGNKVNFKDEVGVGDGGFVVSMKDLKNVQLRKTTKNSMKKSSRRKSFHCSRADTSPPEFCRMKNSLKRVSPSVCRSRTEDDFGEGFTPMLTRALRRKFQAACPVSPIKSFSRSPSPSSNSLGRSPMHCAHQTSPLVITSSHVK